MKSNNRTIDLIIKRLLVYGIPILNLAYFLFSSDTLRNDSLFSLSGRLILLVGIIAIFSIFRNKKVNIHQFISIAILLLILFLSYMSFYIHPSGTIRDFIIKMGSYLSIPAYMIIIPQLTFEENEKKWFKIISVLYAIYFIFTGILNPTYRISTNALMLGYSNSNATGAYTLLILLFLILSFRDEKKKIIKLLLGLIKVVLFYLLILTQCRTAFIIGLICVIYEYLPKKPTFGKWLSFLCFLFPAFFIAAYIFIYNNGFFRDITILNITIYSGRQALFQSAYNGITLLGNYGENKFNGLNYVLSILNTLGVLGLLSYWILMIRLLNEDFLDECDSSFSDGLSRFCLSILLLHGCTESVLFTGGTVFAGMFACLLMSAACYRKVE